MLRGERTDLGAIRIDDSRLDPFDRRVYAAARAIAPGRVVSYAELAARVGPDATAREVGQSLGRNPFPIVVPCHRIVAAGGELGGFSAPGGAATKRRLLTIEDARRDGVDDLFDQPAAAGSDVGLRARRRSVAGSSALTRRPQRGIGGRITGTPSSSPTLIEVSGRS